MRLNPLPESSSSKHQGNVQMLWLGLDFVVEAA